MTRLCRNGHDLDKVGVYTYERQRVSGASYTQRVCRACKLKRDKAWHGQARAKKNPRENVENDVEHLIHVRQIENLQEEIDRETRRWLKDELKAELAALIAKRPGKRRA